MNAERLEEYLKGYSDAFLPREPLLGLYPKTLRILLTKHGFTQGLTGEFWCREGATIRCPPYLCDHDPYVADVSSIITAVSHVSGSSRHDVLRQAHLLQEGWGNG
jgi:hypothetical protein